MVSAVWHSPVIIYERQFTIATGWPRNARRYQRRDQGEGKTPKRTAVLAADSREVLKRINLHFHDLRREAGSRWLDGGMSLHAVRDL